MKITARRNGGELRIILSGELDHHAARNAIPQISKLIDIELPTKIVLDFEYVSFMDSSGIGLIMGRSKLMKECDAVPYEGSRQTLEAFIPAKKANLIDVNCQALQTGYDY